MRRLLILRWALLRLRLLGALRLQALVKRARIETIIARDVRVSSDVRVSVDRGTSNRFELGPGVRIYDDVLFILRGGSVRLGPDASIRRGSVLNVAGELELEGNNVLSYHNVVHCAERIRLGRFSSASEMVVLADSRHLHDGDHEYFMENVETAPIDVGRNVWISTKSSVLMGVTVGDDAVIAAHAVVHADVPAKAIVGGVPARVIQQR